MKEYEIIVENNKYKSFDLTDNKEVDINSLIDVIEDYFSRHEYALRDYNETMAIIIEDDKNSVKIKFSKNLLNNNDKVTNVLKNFTKNRTNIINVNKKQLKKYKIDKNKIMATILAGTAILAAIGIVNNNIKRDQLIDDIKDIKAKYIDDTSLETTINIKTEDDVDYVIEDNLNEIDFIIEDVVYIDDSVETEMTSTNTEESSKEVDSNYVGAGLNDYTKNYLIDFMNTTEYEVLQTVANRYGIDANLLMAIGMSETALKHNETTPGGSLYNGFAVGMFQLEVGHSDMNLSGYNYEKGLEETITFNKENASNLEMNATGAALNIQRLLNHYDGNIYMTIQAYNFGPGGVDMAVKAHADKVGKTYEEIKADFTYTGWDTELLEMHENCYLFSEIFNVEKYPEHQQTVDYLINYYNAYKTDSSTPTYGTPDYYKRVLGVFMDNELSVKYDFNEYSIDLESNELKNSNIK